MNRGPSSRLAGQSAQMRNAHDTWGHTGTYPETFPADLDRLAITLGQLPAETP